MLIRRVTGRYNAEKWVADDGHIYYLKRRLKSNRAAYMRCHNRDCHGACRVKFEVDLGQKPEVGDLYCWTTGHSPGIECKDPYYREVEILRKKIIARAAKEDTNNSIIFQEETSRAPSEVGSKLCFKEIERSMQRAHQRSKLQSPKSMDDGLSTLLEDLTGSDFPEEPELRKRLTVTTKRIGFLSRLRGHHFQEGTSKIGGFCRRLLLKDGIPKKRRIIKNPKYKGNCNGDDSIAMDELHYDEAEISDVVSRVCSQLFEDNESEIGSLQRRLGKEAVPAICDSSPQMMPKRRRIVKELKDKENCNGDDKIVVLIINDEKDHGPSSNSQSTFPSGDKLINHKKSYNRDDKIAKDELSDVYDNDGEEQEVKEEVDDDDDNVAEEQEVKEEVDDGQSSNSQVTCPSGNKLINSQNASPKKTPKRTASPIQIQLRRKVRILMETLKQREKEIESLKGEISVLKKTRALEFFVGNKSL